MLKEQLEPLLLKVQKPIRYVGGEYNSVVKDKAVSYTHLVEPMGLYGGKQTTLDALKTVSYIHLDVYKRQSRPCLPDRFIRG